MKPENRVILAEELFQEIAQWTFPADKFLNDYFRRNRFVGSKDRRFLYDEIYAKIRGLGDCPEWLLKYFPPESEQEIAALNTDAPTDLRINTIKARRRDVKVEGEKTPLSPIGIRLTQRQALQFNGYYEVQDEGSQLAVFYADAKPNERVLDFCAGAGGKSLALACEMKNTGHIRAYDVEERKLRTLEKRAERAGATIIKTGEPEGDYDLVLVDAPCSGTGTWRRQPDAKWRLTEGKLKGYMNLQREILEAAAKYVKPGGRMVYITCSMLPGENEDQVEWFLSRHKGFKSSKHYLHLSPLKSYTDGFFAASLVSE